MLFFVISIKIFTFVSMLRIITHIERLLLTHDCVILPKFGGFVLQILPATYEEEEHSFRPMRKEVMFNVTLQHTGRACFPSRICRRMALITGKLN